MSKARATGKFAGKTKAKVSPGPLLVSHQTRWKALALCIATLLIYSPALQGGPLWDDGLLVFENPLIQTGRGLFDIWFSTRPLDYFPMTMTAYWLGWHLWGSQAIGYHLLNVVLHLANALLLWRLLWRMRVPGAFWGALLFAIHPLCVFSTAWISELKNTLSMLFYLLSINAFVIWMDAPAGRKQYAFALAFFALSLLSKTSVVMLPFGLLALFWWRRGKLGAREVAATLPFFALSFLLGVITVWFQLGKSAETINYRTEPMLSRLAAAGTAVWFYIWKMIAPVNLVMVYPRWQIDERLIISYLPLMALLIALAFLVWQGRRSKSILVALSFFLLPFLPVLGLISMAYDRYSLVANHFAYLSIPVFTAMMAAVIIRYYPKKATPLLIALTIAYTGLSFSRAWAFSSEERLWRDTVKKNPNAWVGYANLGYLAAVDKKPAEAISFFTSAINLTHNNSELYRNRGNSYDESQHPDLALKDYTQAISLNAKNRRAYLDRAMVLIQLNKLPEAEKDLTMHLTLSPNPVDAYVQHAELYARLQKPAEALRDAKRAAELGQPAPPNFLEDMQAMLNNQQSQSKTR